MFEFSNKMESVETFKPLYDANHKYIRAGLLPGLYRLIVRAFKQVIDTVELMLFTVDDWLRFRSGDTRLSLVVRTVLGLLWFPVSYLSSTASAWAPPPSPSPAVSSS